MNILFAVSEMTPFCKTGGLADVIGALPAVLAGMGHEVSVMLPGYSVIDRKRYGFRDSGEGLGIPVGDELKPLSISIASWKGLDVYLLENDACFGRKGLYGDAEGDYADNGERFTFFARGVVEAAKACDLRPDVIHAHDWQTGLVMTYLATLYGDDPAFVDTASLFTIHNLGYQGVFPADMFRLSGLPPEEFAWMRLEYWGGMSFIKGGIVYADAVSTVSESYSREISGEEFGFGLHGVLAGRRDDLFGIINGIDFEEWNPATDPALPEPFSSDDMRGKKTCRKKLLDMCGLRARATTPVFGMVTRLDDQKGLDILEDAVSRLMAMDIRLIILGTGTSRHQETMSRLASCYHDRIHVMLRFDSDMAHIIYAGSDAFLMPSRYEPCGLGQLIAMRYGTLPVVHATGGLKDTVHDIDENPEDGDGFSFGEYSSDELLDAVTRAVKIYREKGKKRWKEAVRRAMARDFSWRASAEKYEKLYQLIRNRKSV